MNSSRDSISDQIGKDENGLQSGRKQWLKPVLQKEGTAWDVRSDPGAGGDSATSESPS